MYKVKVLTKYELKWIQDEGKANEYKYDKMYHTYGGNVRYLIGQKFVDKIDNNLAG